MTRFANPKAAQAMMQTHGHTNLGMPPKPGPRDIGTGAPATPIKGFPLKPGVKPTVTGAPATPIKGFPLKPGVKPTVTGAPPFNPNNPRAAVLPRGAVAVNTQQRQVSPKPVPTKRLLGMNPNANALIAAAKPTYTGPGFGPSAPFNKAKMAQTLGILGSGVAKSMGMKKGGKVSSASKRADGIATKGKTRGRMV